MVDRLAAPDGLGIVEEFRLARSLEHFRHWPPHLELGAGVIDVKAFKAETADEVARRIRAFLPYLPPERLWLNPNCGFWETPRWVAKLKLASLVEGAARVGKELAG